jgi:predicted NodU family carbamoyl transferase
MHGLGIYDGHNASAVLLKDGRIVASVQEERPRGIKNALGLPQTAIQDVLSQAGLTPRCLVGTALRRIRRYRPVGEAGRVNPQMAPRGLRSLLDRFEEIRPLPDPRRHL